MEQRKILIEVTDEEYQKIKDGALNNDCITLDKATKFDLLMALIKDEKPSYHKIAFDPKAMCDTEKTMFSIVIDNNTIVDISLTLL